MLPERWALPTMLYGIRASGITHDGKDEQSGEFTTPGTLIPTSFAIFAINNGLLNICWIRLTRLLF